MTSRTFIALLVAAAVLSAVPATMAAKPRIDEREDKFVLDNDHITVWFQGKKPVLHVFPAGKDADASGYGYAFTEVVEYVDADGDGAPSANEVLARLNLRSASSFVVTRNVSDEVTVLNLTLTDNVKLGGAAESANLSIADKTANVTLVFQIRDKAAVIDADGVMVNVPTTAIKYDFVVTSWPWVDPMNSRLALVSQITGELSSFEAGELSNATVAANGTMKGAIGWTGNASGLNAEGAIVNLTVKAHASAVENGTRLVFTYVGPRFASLVHDPTIGVASAEGSGSTPDDSTKDPSERPVPGPALGIVAAAVGAAAFVMRRRK